MEEYIYIYKGYNTFYCNKIIDCKEERWRRVKPKSSQLQADTSPCETGASGCEGLAIRRVSCLYYYLGILPSASSEKTWQGKGPTAFTAGIELRVQR